MPASGRLDVAAAASTPGTAPSRPTRRSKKSAARVPGYVERGSATSIVSTPFGAEARVDVQQPDERLNQQRSGDQQHRRERDLHDDEHVARAVRAAAPDGAARALAQTVGQSRLRVA